MGHTNSTPNLHLPQFVGSDKPTWLSDVNGAMLAIDTAYGTIEAEASSAATAAAGAVTVAGAAQTAADSAATAAAAAGTNASQALSTANNAASVALQAQTDAAEALDYITGDAAASVNGDGVKTWSQLLDELYAAAADVTLTRQAKIRVGGLVFPIEKLGSSPEFVNITTVSSGALIQAIVMKSSGSTLISTTLTAGGTSVSDLSANAASNGSTILLFA